MAKLQPKKFTDGVTPIFHNDCKVKADPGGDEAIWSPGQHWLFENWGEEPVTVTFINPKGESLTVSIPDTDSIMMPELDCKFKDDSTGLVKVKYSDATKMSVYVVEA